MGGPVLEVSPALLVRRASTDRPCAFISPWFENKLAKSRAECLLALAGCSSLRLFPFSLHGPVVSLKALPFNYLHTKPSPGSALSTATQVVERYPRHHYAQVCPMRDGNVFAQTGEQGTLVPR